MGMLYKVMHFFGLAGGEQPEKKNELAEDHVHLEEEWSADGAAHSESQTADVQPGNVVSLQSVKQSAKMVLMQPHTYEEAQEIADHLKNRRPVIINLLRLPHDEGKRVVDFLSGTVYAIGGEIQKIGSETFLCTPDHIHIQGSIAEWAEDEFNSRGR